MSAVSGTSVDGGSGLLAASVTEEGGTGLVQRSAGVSGTGYYGVFGSGTDTGLKGTGARGLMGVGSSTGVIGSGPTGVSGVTNSTNGIAVSGSAGASAFGVWAQAGHFGTPLVASLSDSSPSNLAVFSVYTTPMARIDSTGRGFFNGGTQSSGADVAEAIQVEGDPKSYEPGDVLVVSTTRDGAVARSSAAYSPLIAGVYATRPGVLLSELGINEPLDSTVPVGIVGIIPAKVSIENGPIRRGDPLVTSSTPGHAMHGTDRERMYGAVIGKALADFDGPGTGVIKVLVNVK
jgi:hypothetical protein